MKLNLILAIFLFVASCSSDKNQPGQSMYSDAEIARMVKESERSDPKPKEKTDKYGPKSTDKTDTTKMSKAEKLMWLHDTTLLLTGTEHLVFEKLFFDEFPNSFSEYFDLYGEGPLYFNSNHIDLFNKLTAIDKNSYYNKFLNISINGVWGADNLRDIGIYRILSEDPMGMLTVMEDRSDDELLSIFHFIYDGPHPDQYQSEFEQLFEQIDPLNSRVAELMKVSFEKLLSEHDGHGH